MPIEIFLHIIWKYRTFRRIWCIAKSCNSYMFQSASRKICPQPPSKCSFLPYFHHRTSRYPFFNPHRSLNMKLTPNISFSMSCPCYIVNFYVWYPRTLFMNKHTNCTCACCVSSFICPKGYNSIETPFHTRTNLKFENLKKSNHFWEKMTHGTFRNDSLLLR